jgi:hypothetical protein
MPSLKQEDSVQNSHLGFLLKTKAKKYLAAPGFPQLELCSFFRMDGL